MFIQRKSAIIIILVFLSPALFISCKQKQAKDTINSNTKNEKRIPVKKKLDRPAYSLLYQTDWKIDSSDTDFDIDGYFTLDAPVNNGFVSFFIYNVQTDEKENVDAQVEAHLSKTMKKGEVSYFERWGNYKGHGAIIKGKLMGIWKAEVKIFSHSTDSSSFLFVSEHEIAETGKVRTGLELIESSFKLK